MQVTKKLASILLLTLLALGSLVVGGQQPKKALTNEDVIRMVKEGLPDNVIVSTIQQFPANYDVSPDGLIQMKRQGVSGSVLTAVQEAQKVKGGKPFEVAASPESNAPPKRVSKVFNDFLFEFDVCQSSGGDSVTCRFLITNKAQERDLGITDGSYFIDSLRDQYSVADMWIGNRGKQFSLFTGVSASNTLIPDRPIAAVLKFQNVKPNITSISVLRIACYWGERSFNVDFSNIPITPKPQPSPTPKADPQQEKRNDVKDWVPVIIDGGSAPVRVGAEPARVLPKGTTVIYGGTEPAYRIPFKYQIKRFGSNLRRKVDLCAGTMTVDKDSLEIQTDYGSSQLGSKCDSKTYRLAKGYIQKLKETFDSHWYDYNPTVDHLYIKFTVLENNGNDKKKKEFYLYPTKASVKVGTRTPTLTNRVLICPDCTAIVCSDCKGELVAMKNLLDEFYGQRKK